MTTARVAILVTSALLTAGQHTAPASERSLEPGDRVRVTAPSARNLHRQGNFRDLPVEGVVRELDEDRLVIRRGGKDREIPLDAITNLEIRVPGSGTKAGEGAILGGLLGAVVGGVIGASQRSEPVCATYICADLGPGPKVMAYGAVGLVVGLALGAGIGSAFSETAWQPVSIGQLQLGWWPPIGGGQSALIVAASF